MTGGQELEPLRPWGVEACGAEALIELVGLGAFRFGARNVIGAAGPSWACTFPFRASLRSIRMTRMGSSITAESPLASETAMGSVDGHRVLGLATGQNGIGTIWMRSGRTACTSSCTKPHSLSR